MDVCVCVRSRAFFKGAPRPKALKTTLGRHQRAQGGGDSLLVSPSLPQRPRRNLPGFDLICFFRTFHPTYLHFTFLLFFVPSWLAFGLHFGSLLGAQVGLSSALVDTLLFQTS